MVALTGMIESGGSIADGIHKMKDKIMFLMTSSWTVWPIWVWLLYAVIPKFARSVADNCFDACWSTFFSWLCHRSEDHCEHFSDTDHEELFGHGVSAMTRDAKSAGLPVTPLTKIHELWHKNFDLD